MIMNFDANVMNVAVALRPTMPNAILYRTDSYINIGL